MPGERGIGDRRAVDVAGPTIERIFEECTLRWRRVFSRCCTARALGLSTPVSRSSCPRVISFSSSRLTSSAAGEDFHRRIQAPLEGIIASDERAPGIVARQPVGEGVVSTPLSQIPTRTRTPPALGQW
ncbi:MAG: hypothetical protein IPK33_24080 [Gemmatimonadetes bacterium]|nr:hypothetical protein [Gemmatimonadota bacterium]